VWGIVEQWGGGGQEIEKKNWEVVEKKGNAWEKEGTSEEERKLIDNIERSREDG
jgi:hypothetical protein